MTPAALGLPKKFESYRPAQYEALEWACFEASKRFRAMALPTGSGKSALAWSIAKILGGRTVYLVSTRGLQDQLLDDFRTMGVKDVRGKSNYQCREYKGQTCKTGSDNGCGLFWKKSRDCPRQCAVQVARDSQLVLTNYACWLASRQYDDMAFGAVDNLICDEAGEIEEELDRHLKVTIDVPSNGQGVMPEKSWTDIASDRLASLTTQIKAIKELYLERGNPNGYLCDDRYLDLDETCAQCTKILGMGEGWVWQGTRTCTEFDPIHPARYAAQMWAGVERVFLMSATLRAYTMRLCGIAQEDYDFREWPAVFPPQNGPVYHLPTAGENGKPICLSWKSTDDDYRRLMATVDAILEARSDRKTLIQSVSYSRAQMALAMSRFRHRMIFNSNGSQAARAADEFRRAPHGSALVSPSFGAGWDFPRDQCEVVIVLKVPFPNTESYVTAKRCEDPQYRLYRTAQDLVQMPGRARRDPTDRAETFILDGRIGYLLGQGRSHFPNYFKVWTVAQLPPAPPKI